MSDKITVTLTGPAKVGGRWRKPGDSVEVTRAELDDLVAGGALAPMSDAELGAAVKGADRSQDLQAQLDAAKADLEKVSRDRDEWRALQQTAEGQVGRLEARVMELEDELNRSEEARAELAAQLEAGPAIPEGSEKTDANASNAANEAPKTAPKKGAGGRKG